jgi:nucleotide-binding universal stress UspA family protein
VRAIRRASSPDDGILEYADEMETDLIVIGTQGSGSTRGPLLGSVADRIIRKASLPVVTVRPDVATDDPSAEVIRDDTRQRLLVVPVDVAEPSEPTASLLAKAKHWAATFDAAVDVLHVVGEPRVPSMYQWDAFRNRMPSLVADVQEQLRDAVDAADGPAVDVATRVLVGRAAEEIVAYASAQHANMLLMATGGPSGLRTYVLGGVTDQVLRTAPCPVCAFKSQDASLIPASNPAASAPDALPSAPATVADAGAQTR